VRSGMRGFAHLQAMECDEVALHAEAWANPRIPDRLRGALGNQQPTTPKLPR